jgi:hypothetical protein
MNTKTVTMFILAALWGAGCRSSTNAAPSNTAASLAPEPSLSEQVAQHQSVMTRAPKELSEQIRRQDLAAAKRTAASMYQTLETLESNRQIASQVCFGANESTCSTFRQEISPDIRSLYDGFVLTNALSTADLIMMATRIETSASFHIR